MGGPSPWRASAGSLGLYALAGGVFAALLWLNTGELLPGVVVATATVMLLFPAELQAASRLSWRLGEFAGQVPGEPEPEVSWWGDQSLHCPDLGLTVSGGTHRFRITGLVAEAGGRTWDVQLSRPREGARRVLEDLGREPAVEGFDGRLPSIYPRLSGVKAGVLAAVTTAIVVGLGGPLAAGGTYPLWWLGLPLAAGVIVGGLRWHGLERVRTALEGLCRGLAQGGIRVERVDRIEGLLRLTFAVRTPAGTGVVRCEASPGGRLAVSHGDRERSTPTADAEATGRELARWLADSASGAGDAGVTAPPSPGDLTAARRLLFAARGRVPRDRRAGRWRHRSLAGGRRPGAARGRARLRVAWRGATRCRMARTRAHGLTGHGGRPHGDPESTLESRQVWSSCRSPGIRITAGPSTPAAGAL